MAHHMIAVVQAPFCCSSCCCHEAREARYSRSPQGWRSFEYRPGALDDLKVVSLSAESVTLLMNFKQGCMP
eukprot:935665-Pleurochrysis_carterae.AAC.2